MHTHDHGNKTIYCGYCERTFKSTLHCRAHENKYHFAERKEARKVNNAEQKESMFICSTCGKIFSQRSKLNIHMKTHSDVKPFKCEHCGADFKSKRNLDTHVEKHLNTERNIKCPRCDLMFYHTKNLQEHLKRHDRAKATHTCTLCPKTFSYRSGLTEHMNSHTLERKFTCEVCGKEFSRLSVLYRHRLIHDSNKMDFSCTLCEKVFKRADHLKTHMRSHANKGHISRVKETEETEVVYVWKEDGEDVAKGEEEEI